MLIDSVLCFELMKHVLSFINYFIFWESTHILRSSESCYFGYPKANCLGLH